MVANSVDDSNRAVNARVGLIGAEMANIGSGRGNQFIDENHQMRSTVLRA
jgi:hypothetical protein